MSDILKRVSIGAIIGLAVALFVGFGTQKIPFLKSLLDGYEYLSYDSRMKAKVSGVEEQSIDDVIIIDIDQNSVAAPEDGGLGNYKDWPHATHGKLIESVSSGNPKAIIFDIIFDPENMANYFLFSDLIGEHTFSTQEMVNRANDFLLERNPYSFVDQTAFTQKAYHALVFEEEHSLNFLYKMDAEPEGYHYANHIIHGIPREIAEKLPTADRIGNTHVELLSASVGSGSANFPQDADGIIRRAPTAIYFEGPEHVYPSLVMSAAIDILGIKKDGGFDYDFDNHVLRLTDTTDTVVREIPIDDHGRMYVNFFGRFKTFYYLPYTYCIDPNLAEYFEDKVAFVGASLPGLMDLRNTPVQETFAGVEVHANVIHSILQNQFIEPTSSKSNLMVILIVAILLGIMVSIPTKPLYTLPAPLVGIVAWVLFTYTQFLSNLVMWEIVRPAMSMAGTYLGIFLYNFLVVEKDKRFLKNTFSTYISPELIDQMYDNKEEPQLGGTEGYHTAFFTDIQSFSGFSEKLSASDLVELLNEYLTEMTDILLNNKGTLDKYIGDAIVAFYGAHAPVNDHEYWACLTAIKMQEGLAELREKWQADGDRWPEIVHHMQNRIGINTGPMVTGNMGSTMRMNYTMMGDTVNLAARLEASAKQYGIYIQVAEESYKACKDKFIWRDLDFVIVMGKTEPAQVFELISEDGNLPPGYDKLLPAYHEAVKLYRNQDWQTAIEAFKASDELEDMFPGRKTNPSRIYIPRCEHYAENPPGDDWDGSWALTKK